jgi:hypothetical protein
VAGDVMRRLSTGILTFFMLALSATARGQETDEQAWEKDALGRLGEFFQQARRGAPLPHGDWYTVLYGPIGAYTPISTMQSVPLCTVQVMHVGDGRDGYPIGSLALTRLFRLAHENDGANLTGTQLQAACAAQSLAAQWYNVPSNPSSYPSDTADIVWMASGVLHALHTGANIIDGADLSALLRGESPDDINRMRSRNGQEIAQVEVTTCEERGGPCQDARVGFGTCPLVSHMAMRFVGSNRSGEWRQTVTRLQFQHATCDY